MAIERDKKEKVAPEPKVEERVEPTATDKLLWKLEEMQKEIERLKSAPKPEEKKEEVTFSIDAIALKTKEALALEDKVKYFVPPDPFATGDQFLEVWLNGYKFQLLKGMEYELPITIYKIITDSITKTMKAQNQIKDSDVPFARY